MSLSDDGPKDRPLAEQPADTTPAVETAAGEELTPQQQKVWAKFELLSFEKQAQTPAPKADFVALEVASETTQEFLPFAELAAASEKTRKLPQDPAEQAAGIIKAAHDRVDQLEREAYEKGFAQGEKDGLELGEQKAKKLMEHMTGLAEEMQQLRFDLARHHEKEILEVVVAIATKIVHGRIQLDEQVVYHTILEALELTTSKNKITLRVNPKDFELVERVKPEFFNVFKDLKTLMITADPALSRGGCLLESEHGEIDATIETQLESIYSQLTAAYREG